MIETEASLVRRKLDEHGKLLYEIQRTLASISVQDEKICSMDSRVSALWEKHDKYFDPDGVMSRLVVEIDRIRSLRKQVAALWAIVFPVSISLLSLSYFLFRMKL